MWTFCVENRRFEYGTFKHLKWDIPYGCMCWVSVLHSCSSDELNYNNPIFFKYSYCQSARQREWGKRTGEKLKGRKRESHENSPQMLLEEESACLKQLTAHLPAHEPQFETRIWVKSNPSSSSVNVHLICPQDRFGQNWSCEESS